MTFIRNLSVAAILFAGAATALAQTCATANDMDAPTKSAIQHAAEQYAQEAVAGNTAAMQQNSIGNLATNFKAVENAVAENKANFANAQVSTRAVFLLDYTSDQNRPEFYCGVFNSPDRTGFIIQGLPVGKWAIAIEDVKGGKAPMTISQILQQEGGTWKLAGFYARPEQIGGHDSNWFLQRAREYRSKSQTHAAWFYYLLAWDLAAPLNFMSTAPLDKIADEMQQQRPPDLPLPQKPLNLTAGNQNFPVFQIQPLTVADVLYLLVRYNVPSIADRGLAFQNNMAVMKAIVERYPEYKDAFGGVVARATDPSGQDYGSLLAMDKIIAPPGAAAPTTAAAPRQ
jgi:hypothetical protein